MDRRSLHGSFVYVIDRFVVGKLLRGGITFGSGGKLVEQGVLLGRGGGLSRRSVLFGWGGKPVGQSVALVSAWRGCYGVGKGGSKHE